MPLNFSVIRREDKVVVKQASKVRKKYRICKEPWAIGTRLTLLCICVTFNTSSDLRISASPSIHQGSLWKVKASSSFYSLWYYRLFHHSTGAHKLQHIHQVYPALELRNSSNQGRSPVSDADLNGFPGSSDGKQSYAIQETRGRKESDTVSDQCNKEVKGWLGLNTALLSNFLWLYIMNMSKQTYKTLIIVELGWWYRLSFFVLFSTFRMSEIFHHKNLR